MKFNGSKKETLSIGTIVEVPTEIPYKKSSKEKETSDKAVKETKKEKEKRLAREATEAKAEKKHKKDTEDNTPDPAPVKPTPERVVVQQPAPVVQQAQQVQDTTSPPIQYKVSAGETLYAISKRFNTTVDVITKLNNLTSTNLVPGQVLLVRAGQQPRYNSPAAKDGSRDC